MYDMVEKRFSLARVASKPNSYHFCLSEFPCGVGAGDAFVVPALRVIVLAAYHVVGITDETPRSRLMKDGPGTDKLRVAEICVL